MNGYMEPSGWLDNPLLPAMDRASKAIPEMIHDISLLQSFYEGSSGRQNPNSHFRAARIALAEIQKKLLDSEQFRKVVRKAGHWHPAAIHLFAHYRLIVGEGSTSRDSNAVRFVVSALDRVGFGQHTPSAVARWLERKQEFLKQFNY